MGKATGFIEIHRQERTYKAVDERIQHYNEFVVPLSDQQLSEQGARCMDCGIPFCHQGCPINNVIPDWNDLVYQQDWQAASEKLHSTNNWPEVTGRVCPAPCQEACTLNLQSEPVSIRTIECAIVDKAFDNDWIAPQVSAHKTGQSVAVIGSGPAGLSAAQELARAGHSVTVYEKEAVAGGLMRLGIPDFKLEKHLIQRRVEQMMAEGVELLTNVHVGVDVTMEELQQQYDAILLSGGSEKPRDLPVPGREGNGIHFAMDFLKANSKHVQGLHGEEHVISAKGKDVVVIGGGDTGSDCIGTSTRHGAKSVTQLEIMEMPPEQEDKLLVWPNWPYKMRTSTSQEEGCEREFAVATKSFAIDDNGNVSGVNLVRLEWVKADNGGMQMQELAGSEFTLPAQLVTLAMGFVHPVHEGVVNNSGVDKDERGNVLADTKGENAYRTNIGNVFAAGDMRRGQSLVVWAIHEGRQAAKAIDSFLTGVTRLAG